MFLGFLILWWVGLVLRFALYDDDDDVGRVGVFFCLPPGGGEGGAGGPGVSRKVFCEKEGFLWEKSPRTSAWLGCAVLLKPPPPTPFFIAPLNFIEPSAAQRSAV